MTYIRDFVCVVFVVIIIIIIITIIEEDILMMLLEFKHSGHRGACVCHMKSITELVCV